MSDKDNKLPPDLFEVDWNDALSEWENSKFVPEVVKDKSAPETGTAGGLPAGGQFYKDPFSAQTTPKKGPAPPQPADAPGSRPFDLDDDEDSGSATIIAAVPKELLRGAGKGATTPKSTRGGLGQLFSRAPDGRDKDSAIDIAFDETPASVPPTSGIAAGSPDDDDDDSVVTSAKPVSVSRLPAPEPLKRPSVEMRVERVSDAGVFDPFSEPTAIEPPTRPAVAARATKSPPPERESGLERSKEPIPVPPDTASSPSLHSPEERRFDPNEETFVVPKSKLNGLDKLKDVRSAVDSEARGEDPPKESEPLAITSEVPIAGEPPVEAPSPPVDEEARVALRVRADWFEAEARSMEDSSLRSRQLLIASELWALASDLDRAEALAIEARTIAPSVLLAHKQARMGRTDDVVALEQELAATTTDVARGLGHELLAAKERARRGPLEGITTLSAGQAFPSARLSCLVEGLARDLPDSTSEELEGRVADSDSIADDLRAAIRTGRWLRGEKGGREIVRDAVELAFDAIESARRAMGADDTVRAAAALSAVSALPALERATLWLTASLSAVRPDARRSSAADLAKLAKAQPGLPNRALLCRAIELHDPELCDTALTCATSFTAEERRIATALFGRTEPEPEAYGAEAAPLVAALSAALPSERAPFRRLGHGNDTSRASSEIAALLASQSVTTGAQASCDVLSQSSPELADVVRLEVAATGHDVAAVCDVITRRAKLAESNQQKAQAYAVVGLVAEQARDDKRATAAYQAALREDPGTEGLLRTVATFDPLTDLVVELNSFAENVEDGIHSAVLRLEAFARADSLDDATRLQLLARAHEGAPSLPVAAFLAEDVARRSGTDDDALFWMRERQACTEDETIRRVESLREARLLSQGDKAAAAVLIERAHRSAEQDLGLRYWYERVTTTDPLEDARFREARAETLSGDTKAGLLLDASYRFEAASENAGAARTAAAADTGPHRDLARVARERAEINAGQVAGLAEKLLTLAKGTTDADSRREAFERLAHVDAIGRGDSASALLWHRSILQESPRHLPSLRHLEQYLVTEGREEELEPIASAIAGALPGGADPEAAGHAQLATRLRLIGADADVGSANEFANTLAKSEGAPLWALRRALAFHRNKQEHTETVATAGRMLPRLRRPLEASHLLYVAAEAAVESGDLAAGRDLVTRATRHDNGDVVTWELFEDLCRRQGDAVGAAEACERLASTSLVREHQLVGWYNAGRTWADLVHETERAEAAFEHASVINIQHEDTYARLRDLYAARGATPKLQTLLGRWRETLTDPGEQAALELERAKLYIKGGETAAARRHLELALSLGGEDTYALGALADLCSETQDWDGAERAWVRLARLLPGADEQRDVYKRLGDLYAHRAVNLPRAIVAYGEVIKRAPEDLETLAKLLEVYKAQGDVPHAVETAQHLLILTVAPAQRIERHLELARVHEFVAKDVRKAEGAFDAARKEFPTNVAVLRALAEFYARQRQTPAVNILLDRVSNEARRAISTGKLDSAHFEMLIAANELRGKQVAAQAVAATFAALSGRAAELAGCPLVAFEPKLDETLAPELISQGLRVLLARTGDTLDAVTAVDLKSLRASAGGQAAPKFTASAVTLASSVGILNLQVFVTHEAGMACTPVSSSPPCILVTEGLANHGTPSVQRFLTYRTLKVLQAKAGSLVRASANDLPALVAAWLKTFNPSWVPTGVPPAQVNAMGGRLQTALSRHVSPELAAIALETAGVLGPRAPMVANAVLAWANRAALLAVGDPNAAFDAIAALSSGAALPVAGEGRAAWVARTAELRELVAFSVSDTYAELRGKTPTR